MDLGDVQRKRGKEEIPGGNSSNERMGSGKFGRQPLTGCLFFYRL